MRHKQRISYIIFITIWHQGLCDPSGCTNLFRCGETARAQWVEAFRTNSNETNRGRGGGEQSSYIRPLWGLVLPPQWLRNKGYWTKAGRSDRLLFTSSHHRGGTRASAWKSALDLLVTYSRVKMQKQRNVFPYFLSLPALPHKHTSLNWLRLSCESTCSLAPSSKVAKTINKSQVTLSLSGDFRLPLLFTLYGNKSENTWRSVIITSGGEGFLKLSAMWLIICYYCAPGICLSSQLVFAPFHQLISINKYWVLTECVSVCCRG